MFAKLHIFKFFSKFYMQLLRKLSTICTWDILFLMNIALSKIKCFCLILTKTTSRAWSGFGLARNI